MPRIYKITDTKELIFKFMELCLQIGCMNKSLILNEITLVLKMVNRKHICRLKDTDTVTFRFLVTKTGFATCSPAAPHFVFLITL